MPPHWLTYVGTDDVDATAAKAKDLGGNVIVEPADIPEVGRFSIVADPTGAVFGLFQPIS
jgi:predicted enzyme related to lactoylglutathione lyase